MPAELLVWSAHGYELRILEILGYCCKRRNRMPIFVENNGNVVMLENDASDVKITLHP